MDKNREEMLKNVTDALGSKNHFFVGLTGDPKLNNNVSFMTTADDMNLVNSIMLETVLNNILNSFDMGKLFDIDESDVDSFIGTVTCSVEKIMRSKLDRLASSVNQGKNVNLLKLDKKNHSAAIAVDISDPDSLKHDPMFQSLPEELQKVVLENGKKTLANAK